MTSLKLDSNNNLVYGYTFFEIDNKERILQDVNTRLHLAKNEHPFDKDAGFDFIDYMQNNAQGRSLKAKIKTECERIEGVSSIQLVTLNDKGIETMTIKLQSGEVLNG